MSKKPEKTGRIRRNKKGQFVKGVSGNPEGKPAGTVSPIQKVRELFRENPEDFLEWVRDYIKSPINRRHIVEMLDGKPKQRIEADVDLKLPFSIKIVKDEPDKGEDSQAVPETV